MDIVAGVRVLTDVTMDDGVGVFFGTVVGDFEVGVPVCFEIHVFVVIVLFEVGETLLGLEFVVSLPVVVDRVRGGITTNDEVGHRVKVGGLFSLVRRETPTLGLGVGYVRITWFDTFWFWFFFY